jgi:hypothetical protein
MNAKLLKAIAGLVIVMLLVSACGMMPTLGSRNLVSEPRNVTSYDRVDVSGGGSMDIIQDGTESLTVETDDNIMQFVTSEVRGGTLFLGLDSYLRSLLPSRLHFTLHVKDLRGIETSGSWDVASESIQTGNLDVVISGSGKVTIRTLAATQLKTSISGSGEMNLTGKAASQSIDISGSGKYRAGDLKSQEAIIGISGTGNVTVWATTNLTAHVSGSGEVGYYGSPQVSYNQSGSGKITSLGGKE